MQPKTQARNLILACTFGAVTIRKNYFFLCLFFLKRFLRLCVAILCLFLFLPLGIVFNF